MSLWSFILSYCTHWSSACLNAALLTTLDQDVLMQKLRSLFIIYKSVFIPYDIILHHIWSNSCLHERRCSSFIVYYIMSYFVTLDKSHLHSTLCIALKYKRSICRWICNNLFIMLRERALLQHHFIRKQDYCMDLSLSMRIAHDASIRITYFVIGFLLFFFLQVIFFTRYSFYKVITINMLFSMQIELLRH